MGYNFLGNYMKRVQLVYAGSLVYQLCQLLLNTSNTCQSIYPFNLICLIKKNSLLTFTFDSIRPVTIVFNHGHFLPI